MILFFYIILNVMVIILFSKMKKYLHSLEILVYWLISSYVFQNFSAFCYMNFKTIDIPEVFSLEFAHFINRIILYPALMVAFLQYFLMLSSRFKKLLFIISSVLLLTGLEWLSDFLGVIKHIHWHFWWSPVFWLAGLLFLISFMTIFRKLLFKGDWRL
ncbi:hypothetical protein [Neobacillus sp. D3-1R]|uniref:hypothetical protein n=1 Tax=Neobacillus sp. D3-1R TaxID=3445778 RepID=UPI003FA15266